jgi:NADH-quinone oxidoreductase subunit L
VQNDIKRVVAYSTLSQLGYMTVALGASAYSAAIFHLMTHAFFKALLFLGAGSVIIAMHHKQDMRKMGGLRKYMPITWPSRPGSASLALIGFPVLLRLLLEGHRSSSRSSTSDRTGASFAVFAVYAGVFITALYSFRMLYLTFHGKSRADEETLSHAHESPWVVTLPLILLAIPSLLIGYFTVEPLLFGGVLSDAIYIDPAHDPVAAVGEHFHGAFAFALHGFMTPVFWLAMAGVATATYIYLFNPSVAEGIKNRFGWAYTILDRKYFFDEFYQHVIVGGGLKLAAFLSRRGDRMIIDGWIVHGSARLVGAVASRVRNIQTGFLYHYAFAMIIGLVALVFAFVLLKG